MIEVSNANLQRLNVNELTGNDYVADVLRLDKIHPVVSGNKWFKLRYYLSEAMNTGKKTIVTFGGAWSNHVVATACAAQMNGLNATGIIRGERPPSLSPTLLYAMEYGMELIFVSRDQYRNKQDDNLIKELLPGLQDALIIPEGGSGKQGVRGAADILTLVPQRYYTHILCAVGTGTMFTGLLNAAEEGQQMIGIPVLKGFSALENEYRHLMRSDLKAGYQFFYDYHFGGYAKKTPELTRFMNTFYHNTGIPTDFVYTGKLMYAFEDLLKKGHFKPENRILLIHSGGLQGNISVPEGTLEF